MLQSNISKKVNDHVATILFLEFYAKNVLSSTLYSSVVSLNYRYLIFASFLYLPSEIWISYGISLILGFFNYTQKPNILPVCHQDIDQITKNNKLLQIS